MFKRRVGVQTIAAVFAFGIAIGPAQAADAPRMKAPKGFKAHYAVQEGSNPPEQGAMYFSHGRIRKEISAPPGGYETIQIVRPDEKKIFQIGMDKRVFHVLPWDSRAALLSEAVRRFGKRKFVGAETVDGQECDKFEVAPKDPGVGAFYIWLSKGSDLPVQLMTKDSDPTRQIKIQWTDVKAGNQPPMLFEPPMYSRLVEGPATAIGVAGTSAPAAAGSQDAGGKTAASPH